MLLSSVDKDDTLLRALVSAISVCVSLGDAALKTELSHLVALLDMQAGILGEQQEAKIKDARFLFKETLIDKPCLSKVSWVLPLGSTLLGEMAKSLTAFANDKTMASEVPKLISKARTLDGKGVELSEDGSATQAKVMEAVR